MSEKIVEFLEQITPSKTKGPVTREFVINDEMKFMAQRIISEKKIDVHPAKIEYVTVEPNISKAAAAKCIKTSKELKFFSGFDYVIEVSGELWTSLDRETREILLENQLRKILVLNDEKTGSWKFKLRKYDISQFSKVMQEHGPDWTKKIKLVLSSLYDMTPAEEDNIQI